MLQSYATHTAVTKSRSEPHYLVLCEDYLDLDEQLADDSLQHVYCLC